MFFILWDEASLHSHLTPGLSGTSIASVRLKPFVRWLRVSPPASSSLEFIAGRITDVPGNHEHLVNVRVPGKTLCSTLQLLTRALDISASSG